MASILVKATFRGMPYPVDILNVYGPYRNQDSFLEKSRQGGLLNSPNLILRGDLNITLRASETWGTKAAIDPLSSHFNLFFLLSGACGHSYTYFWSYLEEWEGGLGWDQ